MLSADATVYWDAKTEYSRYIPGAIAYSVKSIPDIIMQMEEMAQTKISNEIASANLVSALLMSGCNMSLLRLNLAAGIHKDQ